MSDSDSDIGRCHICKEPQAEIRFCPECYHWFCARCRTNWFKRGIEAVKAVIKFQSDRAKGECCGPVR